MITNTVDDVTIQGDSEAFFSAVEDIRDQARMLLKTRFNNREQYTDIHKEIDSPLSDEFVKNYISMLSQSLMNNLTSRLHGTLPIDLSHLFTIAPSEDRYTVFSDSDAGFVDGVTQSGPNSITIADKLTLTLPLPIDYLTQYSIATVIFDGPDSASVELRQQSNTSSAPPHLLDLVLSGKNQEQKEAEIIYTEGIDVIQVAVGVRPVASCTQPRLMQQMEHFNLDAIQPKSKGQMSIVFNTELTDRETVIEDMEAVANSATTESKHTRIGELLRYPKSAIKYYISEDGSGIQPRTELYYQYSNSELSKREVKAYYAVPYSIQPENIHLKIQEGLTALPEIELFTQEYGFDTASETVVNRNSLPQTFAEVLEAPE